MHCRRVSDSKLPTICCAYYRCVAQASVFGLLARSERPMYNSSAGCQVAPPPPGGFCGRSAASMQQPSALSTVKHTVQPSGTQRMPWRNPLLPRAASQRNSPPLRFLLSRSGL